MKLKVDFNKAVGKIKPMHGVGQPPRVGISDAYMHYLTEANIPYSRLHDMGGPYGGNVYVDIPNIFPNFDANEYDPASYSFEFTDLLIKQLVTAKCEPIFRLGVTIENYVHLKVLRLFPPKDYEKWARICEHIVRHYNEGWANGFNYGIKYWEIWNEPDSHYNIPQNEMWHGTKEEYFRLYETASKHLKKCFDDKIKVGGYASCGFYAIIDGGSNVTDRSKYHVEFAHDFFEYINKTASPLDFYSWHSYDTVENTVKMAKYVDIMLEKYGRSGIETHLNEWNNANELKNRGTSFASAAAAAMMITFQNQSTDLLCYYDARIGPSRYGGLFNPLDHTPLCTYYSFKAFGELYALGEQAEITFDTESPSLYALAATDGVKKALLLSNLGKDTELELDPLFTNSYVLNSDEHLKKIPLSPENLRIAENNVILLTNY